ncbi:MULTISPECIES: hypothetical protein [Dietzia]|uniref:hypothetical protein n=1 Tax=Dietzia TaxID=37914 RepID=UPI001E3E13CA|nr:MULTISPECIES: hypothetical protein [Dietzia]
MPADRVRTEVPPVVTAAVGMVVALVSAVFGIAAHGLAAGTGAVAPSPGQILLIAAASAGVGAATAAVARQRSPIPVTAAGLIAGQGVVHLLLASGHTHSGSPGASHAALGHHMTDPTLVRAAMDGAGTGLSLGPAALLTPGMLGAHVAAIAVTLALVAILSGTLAWVAARVTPLRVAAHLVVVAPLVCSYDADTPLHRFLLTGGGTRAPPVAV